LRKEIVKDDNSTYKIFESSIELGQAHSDAEINFNPKSDTDTVNEYSNFTEEDPFRRSRNLDLDTQDFFCLSLLNYKNSQVRNVCLKK
jgi:hypothetical protein